MKIGIMQPYFLPYIGYFQLISYVDQFVIYDDVQFIKGGFINRNKYLVNERATSFILNVKKDKYTLPINERFFVDNINYEFNKFCKGLSLAYKKAPYYEEGMQIIEKMKEVEVDKNIADFISNSLKLICDYLEIKTTLIRSSSLNIGSELKGEDRVIEITKKLKGDEYINSYGGYELYSTAHFAKHNIELSFIKPYPIVYKQFGEVFVPKLSIIDVIMFNSKEQIKEMLTQYEILHSL